MVKYFHQGHRQTVVIVEFLVKRQLYGLPVLPSGAVCMLEAALYSLACCVFTVLV